MIARAVIVAVVLLAARPAWPCPGEPCHKYDFMFTTVADVYVRDVRGETPRRRVNLMKHLTTSGWHTQAGGGQAQTLQLFDAANVPDTYEQLGGLQVFVRTLEQHDHQWRVDLDGAAFDVMRCTEGGQRRTCLVRVK